MAIVVKFDVCGMDSSKYDEVIRRLEEMGLGAPDGRIHHVCYGDPQDLQVIDIFENPAKLEAFGAQLGPLLQAVGIEATPTVEQVYNVIAG